MTHDAAAGRKVRIGFHHVSIQAAMMETEESGMTVRYHVEHMIEMRRIAAWRRGRGEMVMAAHAAASALFHEGRARALLWSWYGETC